MFDNDLQGYSQVLAVGQEEVAFNLERRSLIRVEIIGTITGTELTVTENDFATDLALQTLAGAAYTIPVGPENTSTIIPPSDFPRAGILKLTSNAAQSGAPVTIVCVARSIV